MASGQKNSALIEKDHAQIRTESGLRPPKASLDLPTYPMMRVPASKKKGHVFGSMKTLIFSRCASGLYGARWLTPLQLGRKVELGLSVDPLEPCTRPKKIVF